MALKTDLRSSNDKKFTGHTDNKKLALAPGLLGARKLYKIGKTVIDKTKLDDKLKEKLLKSDIIKDVGKKVKDNFPHLSQSINKKLQQVDAYKGLIKEKIKAVKESKKIKLKN